MTSLCQKFPIFLEMSKNHPNEIKWGKFASCSKFFTLIFQFHFNRIFFSNDLLFDIVSSLHSRIYQFSTHLFIQPSCQPSINDFSFSYLTHIQLTTLLLSIDLSTIHLSIHPLTFDPSIHLSTHPSTHPSNYPPHLTKASPHLVSEDHSLDHRLSFIKLRFFSSNLGR